MYDTGEERMTQTQKQHTEQPDKNKGGTFSKGETVWEFPHEIRFEVAVKILFIVGCVN